MSNQSNTTQKLNNEQHGVLGEATNYPTSYDPSILYAIPRSLGREHIAQKASKNQSNTPSLPSLDIGIDWWHCFEVSWLNQSGISQVLMARLYIPANSTNIVESKSLKLYLNSFNLTSFSSVTTVQEIIATDLSNLVNAPVIVELYSCHDAPSMQIGVANGVCIDTALDNSKRKIAITDDVCAASLTFLQQDTHIQNETMNVEQTYHSDLLRSNCPVTNQPDWGTVEIFIECAKIDEASLLEYILTYRQHNGFHEQCVEQIFSDLTLAFKPRQLMVRAWYTRRGGIDINPCRVSHEQLIPQASRLIRQ